MVMSHIQIDEEGVAWIAGANTKVTEVVLDKLAYGWSPEEIARNHPHLSLAQVYSAFAYDHENKEKMDAEIERRSREGEALAVKLADPVLRQRLIELKKRR
jgi:uncharacterized protein (DUF433 family)